jgi:predicted ATP-grasp superfamily ATP-dependent carboligase
MPLKVLLTTTVTWPFAARLAASFAGLGARVEALMPRGHALAHSRHLSAAHTYRSFAAQASLRAAVSEATPDLVVPCDDRALMQLVSAHRRGGKRMAALVERSLGNPSALPQITARNGFVDTAATLGLAVPKTARVASLREVETRAAAFGFPLVIKRDGSWGGDGVAVARTPDAVRTAWLRLAQKPSLARSLYRAVDRRDFHHALAALAPAPAMSIQAFVPGRPATTSFACWRGRVLAALHFDVLLTSGSRGPATVLHRVDDARMEEAAQKIAAHFGLSGLYGLDFMRGADGVPQLIECNPRATPTAHLAFGDGHDLVASLSAAVLGRPLPGRARAIAGETVALFPQEWRRDPASAYLTDIHHDVPWDDPALLKALIGEEPAQALLARWRPRAGVAAERTAMADARAE